MTISEAIELLLKTREKHGDVEVYFDCPKCESIFTPTVLKAQAVVITGKGANGR